MADQPTVQGHTLNMLGGYSGLAAVLARGLPSSLYRSFTMRVATRQTLARLPAKR